VIFPPLVFPDFDVGFSIKNILRKLPSIEIPTKQTFHFNLMNCPNQNAPGSFQILNIKRKARLGKLS
jgi:hypothetical protein